MDKTVIYWVPKKLYQLLEDGKKTFKFVALKLGPYLSQQITHLQNSVSVEESLIMIL